MYMSTRTRNGRTAVQRKLLALGREVRALRSVLMSVIGEDPEGSYQPTFVKKMLKAAEEIPTKRFKGARDFLTSLRG